MKQFVSIIAALLLTANLFAQTPQKMSYQAVIRNSSNELVTNSTIGMQISILKGSTSGTAVYSEVQTPTTNANGLVSIEIGGGAGFSTINWANDTYFIKTETDPAGGTDYTITGTSQLLSVPYALHSKTAEVAKTAETVTGPTYSIGLNPDLGGYVFYVTPDGKHGKVATTHDQAVDVDHSTSQYYATDPSRYNGASANFADWRLPTIKECELMQEHVNEIGGIVFGVSYWTSEIYLEFMSIHINTYIFNEDYGFASPLGHDGKARVRGVRTF